MVYDSSIGAPTSTWEADIGGSPEAHGPAALSYTTVGKRLSHDTNKVESKDCHTGYTCIHTCTHTKKTTCVHTHKKPLYHICIYMIKCFKILQLRHNPGLGPFTEIAMDVDMWKYTLKSGFSLLHLVPPLSIHSFVYTGKFKDTPYKLFLWLKFLILRN